LGSGVRIPTSCRSPRAATGHDPPVSGRWSLACFKFRFVSCPLQAYHYFLKYCERERPSRIAVLKTLLKRAAEVESEDALIAFKHVHLTCNPGVAFQRSDYDSYRDSVRQIAKFHFPQEMAVKMMLKPLGVGARAGRIAVTTAT
jgi:hypothetical protein